MRRSTSASRVAIRRAKMQQNATECNGMQHILGLHQPYYERSAPSLVEWLLDASAALADRRRAAFGGCRRRLFDVFAGAALAHHLVEEVLYDHEQKKYLALLAAGHSPQHLEQFGVDLFREGEA